MEGNVHGSLRTGDSMGEEDFWFLTQVELEAMEFAFQLINVKYYLQL
jgi:hypothetical protein